MITTGIMAKLHLFHLYVKHWGGGKSFLSGLEDCKKIKRGILRKGYLLWVASLPKHSQDKSTARRWMVMARQGERQGVYAKSSNPKPYLKLTFLDKKKKDRGEKAVKVYPISNLINTSREQQGSWQFGGIHMKGIGPWIFGFLLILSRTFTVRRNFV